jgi:HAD superfamily hydrolase (TIGR01509 family)
MEGNLLRGALIDLDGTLLDTETLYYQVWHDSLSRLGIELDQSTYDIHIRCRREAIMGSLSQLWGISGRTGRKLLHHAAEAVGTDFTVQPFAGASELLSDLHQRGVKVAIVSNSERARVEQASATFGWGTSVDALIAFEDASRHKPHPEPYLRALEVLALPPESCVSVEDAIPGLQASDEAGLRGFFTGSEHHIPRLPVTQEHLPEWPLPAEGLITAAEALLRKTL